MGSVNKVFIIGRLGKDPESKNTSSGTTVTTFSVATSEYYNDKGGNRQEETEWHRIVTYSKTAEKCAKYLHKGSLAAIEGRIKTRSWEDRNGTKRYVTEIIAREITFLDTKPRDGGGKQGNAGGEMDDDDFNQNQNPDDIPF